ncbi:MAG TPA: hypothetical protein VIP08_14870 [Phenylobacterium sp.]|uniref:hypothetical protein n=1 Tax=Phenylobacterium sp. TaxID=1871053 RepID=UPI002F95EA20
MLGLERTVEGAARAKGEALVETGSLTFRGDAVDPATGRKFFLDFPCDLQPGEPVTFVLNLHGGGSLGNWQRHYFPLVDFKQSHRLVIATPTAAVQRPFAPGGPPVRVWISEEDDEHLQNIVNLVVAELGPESVRAFWLAGHSQGGMTSARLLQTPFFADRVDGFISLSGGRLGRAEWTPRFGPPKADGSPPEPRPSMPPPELPVGDFSFIYTTGEREIVALPETSPWAEKYGAGPRVRQPDIVDNQPGQIWDFGRCTYPVWGLKAGPGQAEVWRYPNARDGRVIADVVRIGKGHTEGLEPRVTEALLQLML